uniref:Papilin n=1 Tax=Anopheles dirus TaxID=7168 RepID=A0A182NVJ8_9DIPT
MAAARGPRSEGCHGQYGCCPDGVTAAKGPHNHGCHCSHIEFKCCTDDKTPATGPNGEGCTCTDSKYGGCPDGASEAQGTKFEGCVAVPQKVCTLPKVRGPCHNYTVKHFFDMEYGGCGRFFYGGCNGNNNRFDSADECKAICETPIGKGVCHLPKIIGPCTNLYNKWYYDAKRNMCAQFTYGGCLGNANRFEKLEDCKAMCSVDDSKPPCEQPMDAGSCNGTFERWYYDKESNACHRFYFGGCKGNKNNYPTDASSKYVCFLPVEIGECQKYTAHWYFDAKDGRCRQSPTEAAEATATTSWTRSLASVGASKRNRSRWKCSQRRAVRNRITNRSTRATVSCLWTMEIAIACHTRLATTTTPTPSSCAIFTYTGCGGNGNNFQTLKACERACRTSQDVCREPQAYGDCLENGERWFFEPHEQRCVRFPYSGCGGNGNNFRTEAECRQRCAANAVNRCEQYEHECSQLQCQYGTAKSDGCERCQCNDPCADYYCPPGSQCVADVQSSGALNGTEFVAVCRASNKPGECPPPANPPHCNVDCHSDADCLGNSKCCLAG